MATTFLFRAVASDGKLRTGTLTAETDKSVAQELRRQGLIPVYVGAEKKKTGLDLKLPSLNRGKRKDVLFFTQELSTLLNAGVPLDRALSITAELTDARQLPLRRAGYAARAQGRQIAGRQPGHASRLIFPICTSTWCAPGEASGSLAQIFERLAEFERTRDDLRGYIISSLIYPGLLTVVGLASIFILLNSWCRASRPIFSDPRMKIPTPTLMHARTSAPSCKLTGLPAAIGAGGRADRCFSVYIRTAAGRLWWDTIPPAAFRCWATRCARPRRRGSRAPWRRWSPPACRWCNRSASRAAF